MDAAYILLCGAMWSQFGEEDAGRELIRALSSSDPEVRVLARAMIIQAGIRSKALIGEALAKREISPVQARLCAFEKNLKSQLPGSARSCWSPRAAA
jgi:hypothetical protein